MNNLNKDYELIPMPSITDDARDIAVRWVEGFQNEGGMQLEQKHKLASDIMNYARLHREEQEWKTEEFLHALHILLTEKPKEKIIRKALEELSELQTVLLQLLNKPAKVKPESIFEELADVDIHIILLHVLFPVSREIRQRKINKFLNSKEYLAFKKSYEEK